MQIVRKVGKEISNFLIGWPVSRDIKKLEGAIREYELGSEGLKRTIKFMGSTRSTQYMQPILTASLIYGATFNDLIEKPEFYCVMALGLGAKIGAYALGKINVRFLNQYRNELIENSKKNSDNKGEDYQLA